MAQSQLSCTTGNSENHLVRGPPRSLEQGHMGRRNSGSSTYLVRRDDCAFLHSRPITFLEPLPSVRVCAGCSVVPALAVQLPCGHILCELCEQTAFVRPTAWRRRDAGVVAEPRTGLCPVDETYFAKCQLKPVIFRLHKLHRHRAFCVNRRFGCPFQGELGQVKGHCFGDCCVRRKICLLCKRKNILACDTRLHSKHCLPFQKRMSKQKPSQE